MKISSKEQRTTQRTPHTQVESEYFRNIYSRPWIFSQVMLILKKTSTMQQKEKNFTRLINLSFFHLKMDKKGKKIDYKGLKSYMVFDGNELEGTPLLPPLLRKNPPNSIWHPHIRQIWGFKTFNGAFNLPIESLHHEILFKILWL